MPSQKPFTLVLGLTVALFAGACSSGGGTSEAPTPPPSARPSAPQEPATAPAPPAPPVQSSGSEVLARIAAVGDIACSRHPAPRDRQSDDRRIREGFCRYDHVGEKIQAGNYDRFLPLGDLQYLLGGYNNFKKYYDPYFGPLKNITMPVPGNHESYDPDFGGYRRYFKHRAHFPAANPGGYYSYNVGGWHMIAINSMWCRDHTWSTRVGYTPIWSDPEKADWGCRPGDPMYDWLVKDLADNADHACTLAYFHHPSFFWAGYAGGPEVLLHDGYWFTRPIYKALYHAGADVVLNGHEHDYERFLPMNPKGEADPAYGFTEFISGSGGDTHQPLPPKTAPRPDVLAAEQNTSFGFLELSLKEGGADFRFVPGKGEPAYKDSGSISCHDAPPTA